MSPIEGLSDIRRLPRLGKIRLGIKKEGQHGPYPSAVDYFVCPDEVRAVYGDNPKELDIMFPADELELVAPQWYKCYSYSQGLICKGDGKTCKRKVDTETGDFANRDTREWVLSDGICQPEHCHMIGTKQCRKMMSLLFILPEVPGLGVYQLDTSSFYSIVNMNSQLAPDGFIRPFTRGKIAFIPLVLSIGPKEVTPPGVGRQTINILTVTAKVKLADIIKISRQGPAQVLLPTLEEEEPPDDLMPEEVLIQAEEGKEAKEAATTAQGGGEPPAAISPEGDEKVGEQAEVKAEEAWSEITREAEGVKKKQAKTPRSAPAAEPAPTIEGEGFHIELAWLERTLKSIHWDEDTAKTWAISNLKVDAKGKIADWLPLLNREQAERFTRELNERAARVQPELF